ncbi:MAG: hypothetical protein V4565_10430 [Bacteroidota bacterium]
MKTYIYLTATLTLSILNTIEGQIEATQGLKIRIDIMGQNPLVKTSALEYHSYIQKIEASEIFSKNAGQQFDQNEETIKSIFCKISQNSKTYIASQTPYQQAECFMRSAKELRKEALEQLNVQAQYGVLTNAEEKEKLALNKQQEIFELFEKEIPGLLAQVKNMESAKGNDLMKTVLELKEAAMNAAPNEQKILLNEAKDLEETYLTSQVKSSNLYAKTIYQKFSDNKALILTFLDQVRRHKELVETVALMCREAERLLKSSEELREEANAQYYLAAKLGAFSNAEEKETLAITKQEDTLSFLKTHSDISYVVK